MDCSLQGSSVAGDSPGENTGVHCHALLEGSSQPRDQIQVSQLTGIFFTIWVSTYCCCCITSVVSDSVQPHRQQPIRFPCPWDFPGRNTGVGCLFLLQCMKVKREREVTQSCLTPSNPMDHSPPGSSLHGIFHQYLLVHNKYLSNRYKYMQDTIFSFNHFCIYLQRGVIGIKQKQAIDK